MPGTEASSVLIAKCQAADKHCGSSASFNKGVTLKLPVDLHTLSSINQ